MIIKLCLYWGQAQDQRKRGNELLNTKHNRKNDSFINATRRNQEKSTSNPNNIKRDQTKPHRKQSQSKAKHQNQNVNWMI
jgi:hypothetical protein